MATGSHNPKERATMALCLFDRPIAFKKLAAKDDSPPMDLKVVYLYGNNSAIKGVIADRRKKNACRQLPRKSSADNKCVHIKVLYGLDKGNVHVLRIDVKFQNGWSCFYCPSEGKEGEKSFCKDHFKTYYLTSAGFVAEVIQRWEEAQVLHRLARLGPEVLLEFGEDLEPEIPDCSGFVEDEELI